MDLSVVVNFYNMRREAERTLEALSRRYQRDVEDLEYEVLCIDNGSQPPLDEAWVEGFGPEFRLVRPSRLLPSPCVALNEAARQAKGRHLALMIDGAHLPTPGVLTEAMAALREDPEALVALRQWWVGGEQRWLAANGYTREMEDELFASIAWPADGYGLFQIGSPMGDFEFQWMENLAETNYLVMPATLYAGIGGYDEAFEVAGGGFANLDLLRRAAAASRGPIVALIGEATFHQFHEGTTTNVSDADKDIQVRAYANGYAALRGERFQAVQREQLKLRGSVSARLPVARRSAFPAPIPLTAEIRPLSVNRAFPSIERRTLSASYVEAGLHRTTTWLGLPVGLAPGDLTAIHDIMSRTLPSRTVLVRPEPGLLAFVDSMHRLMGPKNAQIVAALDQPPPDIDIQTRLHLVTGAPYAPSAVRRAIALVGSVESTLVLFRPPEDDPAPTSALRAYARMVSHRGYLIYIDTVFGQPWLGYSTNRHRAAINGLMRHEPGFVTDESFDRGVVSVCPSGFLMKAGVYRDDEEEDYDPSLDELEEFERLS